MEKSLKKKIFDIYSWLPDKLAVYSKYGKIKT